MRRPRRGSARASGERRLPCWGKSMNAQNRPQCKPLHSRKVFQQKISASPRKAIGYPSMHKAAQASTSWGVNWGRGWHYPTSNGCAPTSADPLASIVCSNRQPLSPQTPPRLHLNPRNTPRILLTPFAAKIVGCRKKRRRPITSKLDPGCLLTLPGACFSWDTIEVCAPVTGACTC